MDERKKMRSLLSFLGRAIRAEARERGCLVGAVFVERGKYALWRVVLDTGATVLLRGENDRKFLPRSELGTGRWVRVDEMREEAAEA